MTKRQKQTLFDIGQTIRKFLLSGFVVFTFIAYAIEQRMTHPDAPPVAPTPTVLAQPLQPDPSGATLPDIASIASQPNVATDAPTLPPTETPIPTNTPISLGRYKDGVYQGPVVDAYYGLVEVQATVQNGSLVDVQFIQYPNDRRTSIQINNYAMPYLQQEAIQAQTARINIISGATLTSEAFMMSLNQALKPAVN